MLRFALLALALAAVASAPSAAACCHIYDLERTVGPCTVRWYGDGFDLWQDNVSLTCKAGGTTVHVIVEDDLPPCEVRPSWRCE